jgi:hypothetical protein
MPEVIPDARVRDMEERQRLLKERVLLLGQTLIDLREGFVKEMSETKKTLALVQAENTRLKELTRNLAEQGNNAARKEEVAIIQRQMDLLRSS